MASVTHTHRRHGTRLAFENGRMVEVRGPRADEQASLAWDGTALVGLEAPSRAGPVLVRGERVPHVLFGEAHPVVVAGTAVTWMGAVAWAAPSIIPPIEHPARIPGGAGTTILNVLALLAEHAGIAALRYAGPYPTSALWGSLQQSFRASGGDEVTFTAGALERATNADMSPIAIDFAPAPFERLVAGDGIVVQLRDEIDRVTVRGDAYVRGEGVRRLVAREDGGVTAEVWLGGAAWASVVTVDAHGALMGGPWPLPAPATDVVGKELPRELKSALAELVSEQIVAPLGAFASDVMVGTRIEWGDAGAAAARDRGDHIVVHAALWQRLAPGGLARVALALAEALAPIVASRAQARMLSMLAGAPA